MEELRNYEREARAKRGGCGETKAKPVDDKEMAIIEEIPSLHNGMVFKEGGFLPGQKWLWFIEVKAH